MKIEVGKYYKDSENNIWKVNGKTNFITCSGEAYHCEKMFGKKEYLRCSSDGKFLGSFQHGYGLLVSEFNG